MSELPEVKALREVVDVIHGEAAAALIGVAKSQISRWVRGESTPTRRSVDAIRQGLAEYDRLQMQPE